MIDKELDKFLIKTLKAILEDTIECKEYVKDLHTPEYKEIHEDYDYTIDELTDLLNEITGIDDLAEQDPDIVDDVYELIAGWTGNYIISNEPKQKIKDEQEYNKLLELLSLFMDTDDDYDDSDDDEEIDE